MFSTRCTPVTILRLRAHASLRQLGSAHNALRDKEHALSRMRSETRSAAVDEHPGLMQDLALLQRLATEMGGEGSPEWDVTQLLFHG